MFFKRKRVYIIIALLAILSFLISACSSGEKPFIPEEEIPYIPLETVFEDLTDYLKIYDNLKELTDYKDYEFENADEMFATFAYASARSIVYQGNIGADLTSEIKYKDFETDETLRSETSTQNIFYSSEDKIYTYDKKAQATTFELSGNDRYTTLDEHISVFLEEDNLLCYSFISSLSDDLRYTKYPVDENWMETKFNDKISSALKVISGAKSLSDFIENKTAEGLTEFDIEKQDDSIVLSIKGDSESIEKPSEITVCAKDGMITDYQAVCKGETLFENKTVNYRAQYNFSLTFDNEKEVEVFGVKGQYNPTRLNTNVTFVGYTSYNGYFGDPLSVPVLDNTENEIFMGWYTDVALTKKFEQETFPSIDVTLYPKWKSRNG